MREIPFTRFHLPNGRQTIETIDVDDITFAHYERAANMGFRMTVEILTNGAISMAIEDRELGDFDCVVCANGPQVSIKLTEMLGRFDESKVREWREQMGG